MLPRRTDMQASLAWQPTRHTHLMHAGIALFLFSATLLTGGSRQPWGLTITALLVTCLPLSSLYPIVGLLASLALSWVGLAGPEPISLLAIAVPWYICAMLLARGHSRRTIYPIATAHILALSIYVVQTPDGAFFGILTTTIITAPCLAAGETVRRHRHALARTEQERQERLERQRRLVVSELHDTVVRDLSHAVMKAEQVRLADPHAPGMEHLEDLTGSVRRAVEQLRASLRTMHNSEEEDLAILASSAPRPLQEVITEARSALARRRIDLEVDGLEVLDAPEVGPGMRQQLVRVLGELVTNVTKHAAPGGSAQLVLDSDATTLEAMVTNTFDPRVRQGPDMSSGLGMAGARRRVEGLGGTLRATSTADRWTVTLSVPLTAGAM